MLILPVVTKMDSKQIPYACIALILLNAFVFFFLQAGDDSKIRDAEQYYESSGLLAIELDAYRHYLIQKGDRAPEKLPNHVADSV